MVKWLEKNLWILLLLIIVSGFPAGVMAAEKDQSESPVDLVYRGHIENYGDVPKPDGTFVRGMETIGSRGQGLRMEGILIELTGDIPEGASVFYQVHVQNLGWMDPVSNGSYAGTKGQGLRIEAIKIWLQDLPGYSVFYRGHCQSLGDIPQAEGDWTWVENGEQLGSTGSGLRLEELQVKIVKDTLASVDYQALMESIANLNEEDYTLESWEALQAVLVENPVGNPNSETDWEKAIVSVKEAINALVRRTKIKELFIVNPAVIRVNFDQPVESLEKGAITVENDRGIKEYVKSLKLTDDQLSAEIEFYNQFEDKKTYTIKIDFSDGSDSREFNYMVEGPAEIATASSQIIKADTESVIEYTVYNKSGIDITALVEDDITFASTASVKDGKIKLSAGEKASIYVIYKAGSDQEIRSKEITISAEKSKVVSILNYTLSGIVPGLPETPVTVSDFEAEDFEPVKAVRLNEIKSRMYLYVLAQDQFGGKKVLGYGDGKPKPVPDYKSLDLTVGLIDQSLGYLEFFAAGILPIEVICGDYSQVVEITVEAATEPEVPILEQKQGEVSVRRSEAINIENLFAVSYQGESLTPGDGISADTFSLDKIVFLSDNLYIVNSSSPMGIEGHKIYSTPINLGSATLIFKSATVTVGGKDYVIDLNNAQVELNVTNSQVNFVDLEANGLPGKTTTTQLTISLDGDFYFWDKIKLTGAKISSPLRYNDQQISFDISDITVADGEKVTVTLDNEAHIYTPASRAVVVYIGEE